MWGCEFRMAEHSESHWIVFLLGLVIQRPKHDAMSLAKMFIQFFVCRTGEVQRHRLGLRVGVHKIPKSSITMFLARVMANHFLELSDLAFKQLPKSMQGTQVSDLPAMHLGEVEQLIVQVERGVLWNHIDELADEPL